MAWKTRGTGDHLARIVSSHAGGSSIVPVAEQRWLEPWAGCGCSARPIPIESIADDLMGMGDADRSKLAFSDPGLGVSDAPLGLPAYLLVTTCSVECGVLRLQAHM